MNWISHDARELSLILLALKVAFWLWKKMPIILSKRYSAVHRAEMTQFWHLLLQNAAQGRDEEMKQVWQNPNYGSSQVRGQQGFTVKFFTSVYFENFPNKMGFQTSGLI